MYSGAKTQQNKRADRFVLDETGGWIAINGSAVVTSASLGALDYLTTSRVTAGENVELTKGTGPPGTVKVDVFTTRLETALDPTFLRPSEVKTTWPIESETVGADRYVGIAANTYITTATAYGAFLKPADVVAGTGISVSGTFPRTIALATPVAAAHGGSGQSSYTTGDMLYASGASALSRLGIGAANRVLASTGSAPNWVNSLSLASLTLASALAEDYGGTGQSTYATGDMLYASGANTLAKRTIGSSGQVLTVSGGVPTWATPSAPSNSVVSTSASYLATGSDYFILCDATVAIEITLPSASSNAGQEILIYVKTVGEEKHVDIYPTPNGMTVGVLTQQGEWLKVISGGSAGWFQVGHGYAEWGSEQDFQALSNGE